MAIKGTARRYGAIAIALHWVSALGILVMLGSGIAMEQGLLGEPVPGGVILAHATLGSLILLLTAIRLVWWLAFDRRPEPVAGIPAWQERLAMIVHGLLYLTIFVATLSGISTLVLSSAVPAILAGNPAPEFDGIGPFFAHGLAGRFLLLLLVVHIGAALFHQFVRRDRLLGRMGLGSV
ncbi:MAG: cytochrome protein [Devosia sp.]|nr:cytochrome protein [Devosia sp.]